MRQIKLPLVPIDITVSLIAYPRRTNLHWTYLLWLSDEWLISTLTLTLAYLSYFPSLYLPSTFSYQYSQVNSSKQPMHSHSWTFPFHHNLKLYLECVQFATLVAPGAFWLTDLDQALTCWRLDAFVSATWPDWFTSEAVWHFSFSC